jgi:hypothetical protein
MNKSYKYLGFKINMNLDWTEAKNKLTRDIKATHSALSGIRMGEDQWIDISNMMTRGILGYYGTSIPLTMNECESLDAIRRTAFKTSFRYSRSVPNAWFHALRKNYEGRGMVLAYSEATAAQLGNINRIRNATNTPARLAFEENLRVTKIKFTGSEQGFEAWAPEIWDETTHTEDQIERYLATHNTLYNLIQLNVGIFRLNNVLCRH